MKELTWDGALNAACEVRNLATRHQELVSFQKFLSSDDCHLEIGVRRRMFELVTTRAEIIQFARDEVDKQIAEIESRMAEHGITLVEPPIPPIVRAAQIAHASVP